MANSGIEALKGSWDHVDDENFDEFMKEIGVGWAMRIAAKAVKPRLIISQNDGKWSIKSESTFKTVSYDFTPGVEFNETTPDGREVTTTITFEGNKWVSTTIDKNGKKSVVTRYVDDSGQQMIEMECGSVKARRCTTIDKNGKKSVVTRYVDDSGQQMIEMECGSVKARLWYKRVQ
ncbi:unnamed protein product [Rotaria sp. Silwood1]|nr:unnamed protein product [Rotaria sp. Silwood1]